MVEEGMIDELDVGKTEDRPIDVGSELRKLYGKQKTRTNALLQKEIQATMPIRETTDNIVVMAKLLEQIHDVQSEKGVSDSIKEKNDLIDNIVDDYEDEESKQQD